METSPHAEADDLLPDAPENFQWPQYPEADRILREEVQEFLQEHLFAADLTKRMHEETGTNFFDWVDHIVVPRGFLGMEFSMKLTQQGFRDMPKEDLLVLQCKDADFPAVIFENSDAKMIIGIAVESVEDFLQKHHLKARIIGAPNGPFRYAFIDCGNARLTVLERHGTKSFDEPAIKMNDRATFEGYGLWDSRDREPEPGKEHEYMQKTLDCAKELVNLVGTGHAADIVLDCERNYWMYTPQGNTAGSLMKERLDALGLGWGKIRDHHTFRSSREHFATLVQIFLTLGFKKRERYYAGDAHGWGAQIMEHPQTGDVLFLDVDLFPNEAQVDFSREPLQPRGEFHTVGRWCALHGESVLNAGMHHLEAKFDFDKVRSILEKEKIKTMPPFSDFPYLKQAFTEGEQWYLDDVRLDHALRIGAINQETYDHIVANDFSAIGSHLENLQRRNGYKGFNKKGVDAILAAVDPQRIAVKKQIDTIVNDK